MDSIKQKMTKLANETADAEARIAHFEEIKAQNEAEAEKYEEQLRNVQKKMQVIFMIFCIMIIVNISIIMITAGHGEPV